MFVGGLNQSTTEDALKNYCESKLKVKVVECTALETSSSYKCFKVKMNSTDRDSCLKPECWPKNVTVKKFFMKRNRNA